MKCENCRFLRTEGYEYPESYCGAGVAEDDVRATSDGCSYHYKTLEKRERELDEAWYEAHTITDEDLKRERELDEAWVEAHTITDEDLKIFFGEETS